MAHEQASDAPSERGFARIRRYPGTVVLVLALVIGWAVVGSADDDWLVAAVRAGGLQPLRIALEGEWFRLAMPMWLHAHPMHLLLNGLALVQLGILTEEFFGVRRLFLAFFWSGIAGAFASALFTTTPYVVSVGASGAILGLAGLILGTSWFGNSGVALELDELLGRRLVGGVGATLLFGFLLCLVAPVVDNWAHLGGLLCGLLLSQAWAEPDLLAVDDEDEGAEVLPAEPASERLLDALAFGTVVLALASVGWTAVAGGRALPTFHLEAARTLSERASIELSSPFGWATWETPEVLAQMLDLYDDAGAAAEGLEVFDRAIGRFQAPELAAVTAYSLDRSSGAGRDRDRAQILLGERWVALEPQSFEALNYLAWNLVVAKDPALRDPARADDLAEEALARIPEPEPWLPGLPASTSGTSTNRAAVLDTRAEALFLLGRLDEAATAQEEAVALARELELATLAEMETRERKIARARRAN